jgi:hypothetical protein
MQKRQTVFSAVIQVDFTEGFIRAGKLCYRWLQVLSFGVSSVFMEENLVIINSGIYFSRILLHLEKEF